MEQRRINTWLASLFVACAFLNFIFVWNFQQNVMKLSERFDDEKKMLEQYETVLKETHASRMALEMETHRAFITFSEKVIESIDKVNGFEVRIVKLEAGVKNSANTGMDKVSSQLANISSDMSKMLDAVPAESVEVKAEPVIEQSVSKPYRKRSIWNLWTK